MRAMALTGLKTSTSMETEQYWNWLTSDELGHGYQLKKKWQVTSGSKFSRIKLLCFSKCSGFKALCTDYFTKCLFYTFLKNLSAIANGLHDFGESPLPAYEPVFDWDNERSIQESLLLTLLSPPDVCSVEARGIFHVDVPSASVCLLIQFEKPATEEGRVTLSVYSRKEPVHLTEREKNNCMSDPESYFTEDPLCGLYNGGVAPASVGSASRAVHSLLAFQAQLPKRELLNQQRKLHYMGTWLV